MARREQRRTGELRPESTAAVAPAAAVSGNDAHDQPTVLGQLRLRVAEHAPPTPATLLLDLEAAKQLAFDHGNALGAVRAIEAQGKAVGALREPGPEDLRRLSDEAIIAKIAEGHPLVIEILTDLLHKGEWKPGPRDDVPPA